MKETNLLTKILVEKLTENGDKSYSSTGNNLTDLMFMTAYFEKHLDEVKIGMSEKEKIFSMYLRDPRFGMGRRDLGRKLMDLSCVNAENIVKAGRYDDLWHIPTNENINYLKTLLVRGDELAKKWMPRLTGKDKKVAKAFCKMWNISERDYRTLIKTDKTVEYKLSYAEQQEGTPLNKLFKEGEYTHPLVNKIDFEQVPSLAMTKYLKTFSTREDIKPRFNEYMSLVKENKAKVNTTTANVYDAYKTSTRGDWTTQDYQENAEVLSKKIVDKETLGVEMDAIVILDTSGSMGRLGRGDLIDKATSVAHALSTHSTYARNQLISFSSYPQLMTIKGKTLKEQYNSMWTGDCSDTNWSAVIRLLYKLDRFPEYFIVLSDQEFNEGSQQSTFEVYKMFKEKNVKSKIIWWNFNDRAKTVVEMDEYGNIYLSGYNIQMLKLLENKFDMTTYIDKILEDYKKKINY